MTANAWIALGTTIAALATFLFGLIQYRQAQQWKRAEFVAGAIQDFESTPSVRNAMRMLDWGDRSIDLFPDKFPPDRYVSVDEVMLTSALRLDPDLERLGRNFAPTEAAIRDAFDEFFSGLERFGHFIESGLVSPEEFRPYLIYWIRLIGDRTTGRTTVQPAVWYYIHQYYTNPGSGAVGGYSNGSSRTRSSGIRDLFARYGYDISPQQSITVQRGLVAS